VLLIYGPIGAIRTLHRLRLRPPDLWPQSLRLAPSDPLPESPDAPEIATDDAPDASDLESRAAEISATADPTETWVTLLNHAYVREAATDYLLIDLDTTDLRTRSALDEFLAKIAEKNTLNDTSRGLLIAVRQALAGDPNELASALRYVDDDNSQWRLVYRHMDKLDADLINQIARLRFNKNASLAAIRAGIMADVLTDKTLDSLLGLNDPTILDLIIDSVQGSPERALKLAVAVRESDSSLALKETEARLTAIALPIDQIEQLHAAGGYSNAPWEALTFATPEAMLDEAREELRTDAAILRQVLTSKLSDEHKNLADYLGDDRCRAAAKLLARQPEPTDDDIGLILDWVTRSAASGFIRDYVWEVLAQIANTNTIARITDTIRPFTAVLGFRKGLDLLDTPLAPAVATTAAESGEIAHRDKARTWQIGQTERTTDELSSALYDEDASVRIVATKALVDRLDRGALRVLADDYPSAGNQYWYNVIAYLDDQLYALDRDRDPSDPDTQLT